MAGRRVELCDGQQGGRFVPDAVGASRLSLEGIAMRGGGKTDGRCGCQGEECVIGCPKDHGHVDDRDGAILVRDEGDLGKGQVFLAAR